MIKCTVSGTAPAGIVSMDQFRVRARAFHSKSTFFPEDLGKASSAEARHHPCSSV